MNILPIAPIAFMLVSSAALAAGESCPPREAGSSYPWQLRELMPGDKYAWLYLDIDTDGRALDCRIGENNIHDPYTRFLACRAFKEDWRTSPVVENGKPVRSTIKRYFIMLGHKHIAANRKARKQWFRDHPNERPSCYPE